MLLRVQFLAHRHSEPFECMGRDQKFHAGFPGGEVRYEKQSLLLMVAQPCEMPVLVKTVRRVIAVAQIIYGTVPDGRILRGKPQGPAVASEDLFPHILFPGLLSFREQRLSAFRQS